MANVGGVVNLNSDDEVDDYDFDYYSHDRSKKNMFSELREEWDSLYRKICRGTYSKQEEQRWLELTGKDVVSTLAEKAHIQREHKNEYSRLYHSVRRGTATKDEQERWFELSGRTFAKSPGPYKRSQPSKNAAAKTPKTSKKKASQKKDASLPQTNKQKAALFKNKNPPGNGKKKAASGKDKTSPEANKKGGPSEKEKEKPIKRFKMNLQAIRGRIFRGTDDEVDRQKYLELTGKDASTAPRETVDQREARLKRQRKYWREQGVSVSTVKIVVQGNIVKEDDDSSDSDDNTDDESDSDETETEDEDDEEDKKRESLDATVLTNGPVEIETARKCRMREESDDEERKAELKRQKLERTRRYWDRFARIQQARASQESTQNVAGNEEEHAEAKGTGRVAKDGARRSGSRASISTEDVGGEKEHGATKPSIEERKPKATKQQHVPMPSESAHSVAIGAGDEETGNDTENRDGNGLSQPVRPSVDVVDLTLTDDEEKEEELLQGDVDSNPMPDKATSYRSPPVPPPAEVATPAILPTATVPAATRPASTHAHASAAAVLSSPSLAAAAPATSTTVPPAAMMPAPDHAPSMTSSEVSMPPVIPTPPSSRVLPMTPISTAPTTSTPVVTPSSVASGNAGIQDYRALRLLVLSERDNRDEVFTMHGLAHLIGTDIAIPEVPGADVARDMQLLQFELEDLRRGNRNLLRRVRAGL